MACCSPKFGGNIDVSLLVGSNEDIFPVLGDCCNTSGAEKSFCVDIDDFLPS
jgi:hypothetical protein